MEDVVPPGGDADVVNKFEYVVRGFFGTLFALFNVVLHFANWPEAPEANIKEDHVEHANGQH